MKREIIINVNGKEATLDIDPGTPLLYVLRNQLKLNGPKYGCGLEQCGSCMVLIDGEANPSCRLPVAAIRERKVVTLEGLTGENEELHPLQEAFYEEQAAQCGFCLNGMLVSAVPLLKDNPQPSRQEITEALERVLCRCGTHTRIFRAIQSAASKNNQQ